MKIKHNIVPTSNSSFMGCWFIGMNGCVNKSGNVVTCLCKSYANSNGTNFGPFGSPRDDFTSGALRS